MNIKAQNTIPCQAFNRTDVLGTGSGELERTGGNSGGESDLAVSREGENWGGVVNLAPSSDKLRGGGGG